MPKVGDVVLIEAEIVKHNVEKDYFMVLVRGVAHPVPVAATAIHLSEDSRYRHREVDFAQGRTVFATNLRRIRQGRNMTQRDLAEKVGVAQGAVWHWEQGRTFPRVSTLEKVSSVLSVSLDQLFGTASNVEATKVQ